jgi:DNA-binding MarR family transcriptional regulator
MTDTATRVRNIITNEPGISCAELAKRLNVTPGRVSQVLKYLKDNDVVTQKHVGKTRQLHLSDTAARRRLLSQKWR